MMKLAPLGMRAAFEVWLAANPHSRLWNTTDAMFASYIGAKAEASSALAQQAQEVERLKEEVARLKLANIKCIASCESELDQLRAQLAEAQQTLKDHGEIQTALCQQLAEQKTLSNPETVGAQCAACGGTGRVYEGEACRFCDGAEQMASAGGDADPSKLFNALQKLVRLKALKEAIESRTVWNLEEAKAQYESRKEAAWAAAREVLRAQHPPESAGGVAVPDECRKCVGVGSVIEDDTVRLGFEKSIQCPECNGTGLAAAPQPSAPLDADRIVDHDMLGNPITARMVQEVAHLAPGTQKPSAPAVEQGDGGV
jgi:hypothetical protein